MSPKLTGGWRDGSCSWCLISHFAWRSNRTTVVSVATQVVLPENEWTQNDSRLMRLLCAGVLCVAKSWSFSCEGNWGTVICGLLLFRSEIDVAADWKFVQFQSMGLLDERKPWYFESAFWRVLQLRPSTTRQAQDCVRSTDSVGYLQRLVGTRHLQFRSIQWSVVGGKPCCSFGSFRLRPLVFSPAASDF